MSSQHGFSVSKPISLWNKPLKADFKDFFKSLTKAGAQGALGNWTEATTSAVDALSAVGLGKDCGEVAWLLIRRSLAQAIYNLVEENAELLNRDASNPAVVRRQLGVPEDDPEAVTAQLDLTLENAELVIDENFFKRPRELPVLEQFKTPFMQWLQIFGLNEAEARSIANRLPSYFVFALNDQWRTRPDDYACLKELMDTPFTKASSREQAWSRYSAWLEKQVDERMFFEAFGLRQVYVQPRAFYEEKSGDEREARLEPHLAAIGMRQRTVVDLQGELEAWLNKTERDDAVRVISGGPGSGKSSFTKMFAAKLAGQNERRVLFVPLHHFELADDLEEAVRKFVRYDRFLPPNPLDPEESDSQLLIIFDGLDELAMQGKAAAEVAQQFVREVLRKTYQFNLREPRLKVLISGRQLVVEANASEFRKPRQILHVLPYFVPKDSRREYGDPQELLKQDQRQDWWSRYGEASGREFSDMPQELNRDELLEITSQPLLNYLVALSFVRGKVDLSAESNLNVIYEDLLKAVHQRGWAEHQHPAIREVQEEQFVRLLEEIAVAAWHGDGRTTTVKEIEDHCESSGVKSLLNLFPEGAGKGVTSLLMAFYFRGAKMRSSGDKTFEFTHKSFGEYLTARRIVRVVERMQTELENRRKNIDSGWDEREALTHWIKLCGPTALNNDLFKFIKNEVRLFGQSVVASWQETLCKLIGFEVRNGMPMEKVGTRPTFQEESRQARNAEESLLAVLNACALVTEKESNIDWPTETAFGELLSRIQGQRSGRSVFILSCLSFLNLKSCVLHIRDFYSADFRHVNLVGAWSFLANFSEADLTGADLTEARFWRANFTRANLTGANLTGADLTEANLKGIYIQGAILRGVNFEGAIFENAAQRGRILRAAAIIPEAPGSSGEENEPSEEHQEG